MASRMSLQRDIEIVPLDAVRGVAQHQVAVAVLAGDLERRLVVARPTPAGELLVLQHLARIEGGDVAALRRRGQIVHAPQRSAPVQMPQRAIRANSHGVGALARGQQPDLAGLRILNRLGGKGSGRGIQKKATGRLIIDPSIRRGADSQSAASRLIGTLFVACPKSVPMSRDAAGTSACATGRAASSPAPR